MDDVLDEDDDSDHTTKSIPPPQSPIWADNLSHYLPGGSAPDRDVLMLLSHVQGLHKFPSQIIII